MTNQARIYDHPFAARPQPAKHVVRIDTLSHADRSTLVLRGILADRAMRSLDTASTRGVQASMFNQFFFLVENTPQSISTPGPARAQGVGSPWRKPKNRSRNEDFERTLVELSRLEDGWAGLGSLAPRKEVLKELDKLLMMLPLSTTSPEFEVDSGDGTLSLVWSHGERAFSVVLNGNSKVVGVLSPASEGYRAWSLPITSESQIARRLESAQLSEFFTA